MANSPYLTKKSIYMDRQYICVHVYINKLHVHVIYAFAFRLASSISVFGVRLLHVACPSHKALQAALDACTPLVK